MAKLVFLSILPNQSADEETPWQQFMTLSTLHWEFGVIWPVWLRYLVTTKGRAASIDMRRFMVLPPFDLGESSAATLALHLLFTSCWCLNVLVRS